MHSIILVALLTKAYAQTLHSCAEYCEILKNDGLQLFWRPDCLCTLDYQKNHATSRLKRLPVIDDSAIYYEPSDEYPNRGISFSEYPFYIINPTFHNPSNKKYIRETEPRTSKQKSPDKIEKKMGQEEDSPLYLDIDIYKNIKNQRSSEKEIQGLKKINLTEDDLMECIDLHILVFSRNNHDADLKDMWDQTKINKYKELSDSDLVIEIQSKCQKPSKVINDSIDEIKKSWPRKSKLRLSQDIENITDQSKTTMGVNVNNTSTQSVPSTDNNKLRQSIEQEKKIISSLPTTTERIFTDLKKLTMNPTVTNDFAVIFSESSTEGMETTQKFENIYTVDHKNTNQNDILTNYTTIHTMSEETTTTADPYTNLDSLELLYSTENNSNTNFKLPRNIDTSLVHTTTTGNTPFTEHHIQIMEKDMNIPVIITKEYGNDSVVSGINGTEQIPNSDFIEKPSSNSNFIGKNVYETTPMTTISTKILSINDLNENSTQETLDTETPATSQATDIQLERIQDSNIEDKTRHFEDDLAVESSGFSVSYIIPEMSNINKVWKNITNDTSTTMNPIQNAELYTTGQETLLETRSLNNYNERKIKPKETYVTTESYAKSYTNTTDIMVYEAQTTEHVTSHEVKQTIILPQETNTESIELKKKVDTFNDLDIISNSYYNLQELEVKQYSTTPFTSSESSTNSPTTEESEYMTLFLSPNLSSDNKETLDELNKTEKSKPAINSTRRDIPDQFPPITSPELVGKLYFLFGEKQIPVRFVQNSDGQLKLGLDGVTLCDKIIEKGYNESLMMTAICKCFRSGKCTNNDINDLKKP